MKSYTDIEQSKKLAEFLPLESADMCYLPTHIGNEHHFITSLSPYSVCTKMTDVSIEYCTPCWSLSALLGVLPKEINALGTIYSINIHTKNEKWFIDYKCNNEEFVGAYSNIFLDACYELILKLKELKML